jgi:hypothetical protein
MAEIVRERIAGAGKDARCRVDYYTATAEMELAGE